MSQIDDFGINSAVEVPGLSPKKNGKRARSSELVERTEAKESHRIAKKSVDDSYNQWADVGMAYMAVGKTYKTLSSGCYKIDVDSNGNYLFNLISINVDQFIRVPNSLSDQVLTEIEQFWEKEQIFKKYGFLHRRGYLFYGPAGGGKSVLVNQIIDGIIKRNGIVLFIPNVMWISMVIQIFRLVEPNRQIAVILEDIDAIIENQGESEVLSYLDGEGQADKILNIATTNYPERLDKRIVARPRRFDRVIKITTPDETTRREYFKKKANLSEVELEEWVRKTEGFTFAALADLIISTKCFEYTFEDSLNNLRKLLKAKPSSQEFENSGMGFYREEEER